MRLLVRKIKWKVSEKQAKHLGDKSRYLLIEGSAGSGKTIFAAHQTVLYAITHPRARILVCRQTMPSLKETSWYEIRKLLHDYEIPFKENKTDAKIVLLNNKATILFRSLDDEQKIRSLSVDYIYIEQAEEITKYSFYELRERLRGKVSKYDYGQFMMVITPDTKQHWIYKLFHVQGVENTKILHFMYTENPFLPEVFVKEYEELKHMDYDLYVKYTLGQWGDLQNIIYDNWDTKKPEHGLEYYSAGVDFGFNNPSCFLLIGWYDNEPYVLREVYKRGLTNQEFIHEVDKMLREEGLYPGKIQRVFADSAEPDRLVEFSNAGYDIIGGVKNVEIKIDSTKRTKIHINPGCTNTIKEIESYVYQKDKDGNILDKPVKFNDHAMDALGYCVYGNIGVLSPIGGQKRYEEIYTY